MTLHLAAPPSRTIVPKSADIFLDSTLGRKPSSFSLWLLSFAFYSL
jgi:hypothetical protein